MFYSDLKDRYLCRSSRRPSRLGRGGLPWDARPLKKERGTPSRGERGRGWPAPSLFTSESLLPAAFRESRDVFDKSKVEGVGRSEVFRSAFNPNNTPPPAFNPSQPFSPAPSSSSQQNFFVPSFSASPPFFASSANRGRGQFVDQVAN